MIVGMTGTFDSAHFIPNHEKCGNMHGHTYRYDVQLSGGIEHSAMVMDFAVMKRVIADIVCLWDHKVINDTITIPTAEAIAYEMGVYLVKKLEAIKSHCVIRRVRVYETPTCYAEWRNSLCQ